MINDVIVRILKGIRYSEGIYANKMKFVVSHLLFQNSWQIRVKSVKKIHKITTLIFIVGLVNILYIII